MLPRRTGHADERCLPFLGHRCLYRRSPRPGTELMTNARTAPRRGSRGYAWSLRPRLAGPVLAPAVGGLVGSLLVLVTAGRAAAVPVVGPAGPGPRRLDAGPGAAGTDRRGQPAAGQLAVAGPAGQARSAEHPGGGCGGRPLGAAAAARTATAQSGRVQLCGAGRAAARRWRPLPGRAGSSWRRLGAGRGGPVLAVGSGAVRAAGAADRAAGDQPGQPGRRPAGPAPGGRPGLGAGSGRGLRPQPGAPSAAGAGARGGQPADPAAAARGGALGSPDGRRPGRGVGVVASPTPAGCGRHGVGRHRREAAGGFTAVATDAMATAASGCWRRHNANAATRPAAIRASQCAAASSCSRISGLATASTSTSGRRCAGLRSQTATATSTKARAATRCRASRAATGLPRLVASRAVSSASGPYGARADRQNGSTAASAEPPPRASGPTR